MTDRPFMTDHQMIAEIRDNVQALREDFQDLRDSVVLKEELNMWRETQKTTRRYVLGAVVSITSLLIAATWLILALNS